MRIKVCGLTKEEQAVTLGDMGVSFGGFIFYPKSPRYALKEITKEQIRKINNINKVGVFVNAPADYLLRTVDECRLQAVQLHGDETPRYCDRISNYISVIKAFGVGGLLPVETYINEYADVVDLFLFDTSSAGYGGSGKKFNWGLLKNITVNKPFLLSGGIGPDDINEIKKFAEEPVAKDLFAVDINSRFEISPGIKDLQLIKEFLVQLNKTNL